MIKEFLMRRARKKRELRSQLADTLLQRLERENSLIVDDELVAESGVGRRLFFRAVYSMVIQERMHMMADGDGRVILMTNGEFHRFMLRRSTMRETEFRRRDDAHVLTGTVAEQAVSAREEDTVWIDSVAAELATLSTQPDEPALDELDSTLVAATLGGSPLSGILPDRDDETLLPLAENAPAGDRENRILRKPTRQLQLAGQPAAADGDADLGWFNLDVATDQAAREKLPDTRQSLPERRREPWALNEESGSNFDGK